LVFLAVPALAHKVTIFAWVEGDTVYTQSKFSGGKRAQNSTVVVYDMDGNQLLEGKTDENGEFSFKVPKKTGLKVALKASMGHLAEWTIPAEEITVVADAYANGAPEVAADTDAQQAASLTDEQQPAPTAVGLSREEVQALIDESLDRKLKPVLNMLADAVAPGPQMSDVIGGIGYIFGLVGVALYFSSRGKRK
jgi:nickel transport protein